MKYYDRLYGKINLDNLLADIVSLCPEIKRLRYVGMMNYRSIEMLGLTTISRLEHVIGTAYLSQVFAHSNNIPRKNNLLTAAIYHDVNCAPFGHAIEWAIDRYTSYEHESGTKWMLDEVDKIATIRPKFYDENGLHRYNFKDRYQLDFKEITNTIQGANSFVISNDGIDLDNIDNVYRMASCMGILGEECTYPILLAKNLRVTTSLDNFLLKDKLFHLIEHWHALRSKVYNKFIYSREYFAYEGMLFKLMSEYVKTLQSEEDIANIWTRTDESLLLMLINAKNDNLQTISKLARKLILLDYDKTYFIIKTNNYDYKNKLSSETFLTRTINEAVTTYNKMNAGALSSAHFYLHVTTDNKKTSRKITLYLEDSQGNIGKTHIGEDEQSLLIGFIGSNSLPDRDVPIMASILIDALSKNGVLGCKVVPFADEEIESYEQLGLF